MEISNSNSQYSKFPLAILDDPSISPGQRYGLYVRIHFTKHHSGFKEFSFNKTTARKWGWGFHVFKGDNRKLKKRGYLEREQALRKVRGRWSYATEHVNLEAMPNGGRSGWMKTSYDFIKLGEGDPKHPLTPTRKCILLWLRSHRETYVALASTLRDAAENFGMTEATLRGHLRVLVQYGYAFSIEKREKGVIEGLAYCAHETHKHFFGRRRIPWDNFCESADNREVSPQGVNQPTVNRPTQLRSTFQPRLKDITSFCECRAAFSSSSLKTKAKYRDLAVSEYLEAFSEQDESLELWQILECMKSVQNIAYHGYHENALDDIFLDAYGNLKKAREHLSDEHLLENILLATDNRLGRKLRTPASMEAARVLIAGILDKNHNMSVGEAFGQVLYLCHRKIGSKPGAWLNDWGLLVMELNGGSEFEGVIWELERSDHVQGYERQMSKATDGEIVGKLKPFRSQKKLIPEMFMPSDELEECILF